MIKRCYSYFQLTVIVSAVSLFFSCQQPVSGGASQTINNQTIIIQSGFIKTVTVSTITNFTMGSALVGSSTAIPEHIVPLISSFKIGKYEISYDEWATVRTWATANGYTFANPGMEGNDGIIGAVPTTAKNEPVTTINWRDMIVWCNAASQYDGLTPVYFTNANFTTPLKVATNIDIINSALGSEDNPYVNWSANGYRLPTEAEWEAAARYQNGTTWTTGDYASGATGSISDAAATGNFAWYTVNSGAVTHDVGTKNSNRLVLYDMSGNVSELCWDYYGLYTTSSPYTDSNPKGQLSGLRILRGGSYSNSASSIQISIRNISITNYSESNYIGFRIVRSN